MSRPSFLFSDLRCQDLSFTYSHSNCSDGRADFCLSHLTAAFTKPQLVGLVGRNGSGKSTLLRVLARLMAFNGGVISLNGRDIQSFSLKDWSNWVSWLGPNHGIYFEFSVTDLLKMGLYPKQRTFFRRSHCLPEQWDRWVDAFDLRPLLSSSFQALSSGQQQRVMLAKILIQDTPIVFLDEPFRFLDLNVQLTLWRILKEKVQNGALVIVADHYLPMVIKQVDRLMVLDGGRMVFDGAVTDAALTDVVDQVFDIRLGSDF